MTDKIITGLKDLIKDRESFIDKEDKSDKDNIFIKDKEVLEEAIETIQEKDKEIEKYKNLYQKALDNTISADRENIRKDNIINKISQNPFNELKVNGIRFCGADIKQYFERKVNNGRD